LDNLRVLIGDILSAGGIAIQVIEPWFFSRCPAYQAVPIVDDAYPSFMDGGHVIVKFFLSPFDETPQVISLCLGGDGFSKQKENGWKIVVIVNEAINYFCPLPRGFDKKYQIRQLGIKPRRGLSYAAVLAK
jgi:hypothetical protein